MFTLRNVAGSRPVKLHGEDLFEVSTANVEMLEIKNSLRIQDHASGLGDLIRAYPELNDIWINRSSYGNGESYKFDAHFIERYGRGNIVISCLNVSQKSIFLHELQHAIQWIDKRPNGSNYHIGKYYADFMLGKINARMSEIAPIILRLSGKFMAKSTRVDGLFLLIDEAVGMDELSLLKAEYKSLCAQYKVFSAFNAMSYCYEANQGEIEARLSASRGLLSVEELIGTPFTRDYKVECFNTCGRVGQYDFS